MNKSIEVRGAREHNLKNVDVSIPKDQLVVFTGISGSGKSSMAFDTIYAEGQRRYVESLSSYARQFLGVLGKPDVDHIDGLSPSISIDQKSVSHNRRSTVGTITEIYDYFRLLFARIGHPFCPQCGAEISKLSVDEIAQKMMTMIAEMSKGSKLKPIKIMITSPVVRRRKGEFSGLFDNLLAKGYNRAQVDGKEMSLDTDISLIKTNTHDVNVIIDSFSASYKQLKDKVFFSNMKSRVFTAVEQAVNLSDGLVYLQSSPKDVHLFSEKFSCPNCNISLPEIEPRIFSFNSPLGACEGCKGLGSVIKINPRLVLNEKLTINEGGIIPYGMFIMKDTWFSRLLQIFLEDNGVDMNKSLGSMSEEKRNKILYGSPKDYRVDGKNRQGHDTYIVEKFTGVIPELQRKHVESESEFTRREIEKYMNEEVCETCQGKRLKDEVLNVKILGKNIYEVCNVAINHTVEFVEAAKKGLNQYDMAVAETIFREISARLEFLINVGLTYLTLNRSARTLSGGESQRIRLASQIGSGLSGVIYVLDEPSIGLHPRDVSALVDSLKKLRDVGNTIIVVEHDPETILKADYIVDFGKKAGKFGGNVVFQGNLEKFKGADTITADYLFDRSRIKRRESSATLSAGTLTIKGCSQFNLKNVSASLPLGKLICITGVSGSGKSTLIVETLYKALKYQIEGKVDGIMGEFSSLDGYQYLDKIYLVDQAPIGRTPRSNPATYIGAFDHIRDIFAETPDSKMRGYKKGRFSFNVKGGRCEKCGGAGTIKVEMQFLPDVYITCDVCQGKRYNSETLEVKHKGKTIYDILSMTIDEALEFFSFHKQLSVKLETLRDIGLSYVELGRPAPTLSGGEAQRVKIADELSKKESGRTLYILDEPTTGLHLYDIDKLLNALYKLVEKGNTVVVIEHNLDVIKNADYIIDLGPEGGEKGGQILFQGTVNDIIKKKDSHTAHFLRTAI